MKIFKLPGRQQRLMDGDVVYVKGEEEKIPIALMCVEGGQWKIMQAVRVFDQRWVKTLDVVNHAP